MVPIPEENDSNLVIIIKMTLIILTLFVVGFGALSQGINLLKFRLRSKPRIGFTGGK